MQPNARRYMVEFGGAMLIYVVFVLASVLLLRAGTSGGLRLLLAAAPVMPAGFGLWAVMRFYRTLDELHQRIVGEAVVFSFLMSGFVTFAYGFLENAGLPRLSFVFVFPLMIALWGVGMALASRRYA